MAAPADRPPARPYSLRLRLLWATVASLALALLLAGVVLTTLFRDHVISQFQASLERQLDQLMTALEFDPQGRASVGAGAMFDPRMHKPYSGLYWQVDELSPAAHRTGIIRSRSLWDANLAWPQRGRGHPGHIDRVEGHGPGGEQLLMLSRIVSASDAPDREFRLIVGGDLRFNLDATRRFGSVLALALSILLILLCAAAWAQVGIGLLPLRRLQEALGAVREGRQANIEGRYPQEVQPLVADFNQVLAANAAIVARARCQAGNLAHALKTPLAVLENEADHAAAHARALPLEQVREQLAEIRRQLDWQLMRARAAAAHGLPGRQTDPASTLAGLLRVLEKVFAERGLRCEVRVDPATPLFAGESQDLQEMLGNLLENAFKWARSSVSVSLAPAAGKRLAITIRDDGPGIDPAWLDAVRERGVRLDEKTPGSGLGLAIVQELAKLYEAGLSLANREDGSGLIASLNLPAA